MRVASRPAFQAHTSPTPIVGDEFHSGGLEGFLNLLGRLFVSAELAVDGLRRSYGWLEYP